MFTDAVDLRDYYETGLGDISAQMLSLSVRRVWPDLTGQSLLGLGYATPYLDQYRGEAERVVALMPANMGVVHWPLEGRGLVGLAEESELPIPSYSIDRVMLVHGLETSRNFEALLQEIWRVLTGDGRLLVAVPNRTGVWARADRTPFGWGHPYSAQQLSRVLRHHLFTPTQTTRALFMPPFRFRALIRSAAAWERIGQRVFPHFSGVVMIEAGKQIYAAAARRKPARLRRPVLVPVPKAAGRTTARNRTE
ncbi:MAG TPA: class I SAM-dependent methyltransferase [Kiloniellaceae bacterium]|nr:class I SAM-dependent methyltransferase [Kiloniellaceae bacterium]